MTQDTAALLDRLVPLIRQAGDAIMRIYATDFRVDTKGDASPVTAADTEAERIILAGLAEITPDVPVVAEEAVEAGRMPEIGKRFWLVDPLDGTREFVKRNGEFTVNIALIDRGRAVLGLVLVPARETLYLGALGVGAFIDDAQGRRRIECRVPPEDGLTVVASRSHGDDGALKRFLAGRKVAQTVNAGSSLKLCLVAEGRADVYPRLGRTMEWDIAAGHAIVAAAGGRVVLADAWQPLTYGKPGMDNPHFVAWGRPAPRPGMEQRLDTPLSDVLAHIQERVMTRTSYFGVKTLKSPTDAWVYQELLVASRPDVVLEIGNNCGGSTLALAHLCDNLGHGRVIGLDIDHSKVPTLVREHPRITLITGDASANAVKVRELIQPGERVMIIEDSSHTYANTLKVLRTFADLVQPGDYFIVEDSICHHGLDVGPNPGPFEAIEAFIAEDDRFEIDRDAESFLITWNPKGYLRRR